VELEQIHSTHCLQSCRTMMRVSALVALLLLPFTAAQCSDEAIEVSTKFDGVNVRPIFTSAGSVADFYGSSGFSGPVPGFGGNMMWFFHQDTSTCDLSFVSVVLPSIKRGGDIGFTITADGMNITSDITVNDSGNKIAFNNVTNTTSVALAWEDNFVSQGFAYTIGDSFKCISVDLAINDFTNTFTWKWPRDDGVVRSSDMRTDQTIKMCLTGAQGDDFVDKCEAGPSQECGIFNFLCALSHFLFCLFTNQTD